jgi:hypothetical protein
MHYKTPALHFNVEGLEPLLAANANRRVHSLNAKHRRAELRHVGDNRLIIFDYKR